MAGLAMVWGVEQTQCLTASGSDQLVAAVPCLLGFRPADSVVAVIVRHGRVKLTMRWDLAVDGGRLVGGRLGPAGLLEPGDDICLIGYGSRLQVRAGLASLRRELGKAVRQVLIVEGDRWWYADEPATVPGRPVGPGEIWAACSPRGDGSVAPSRQALAATIGPPTGQREDDLMASLVRLLEQTDDQAEAEADRVLGLIDRFRAGQKLGDDDFLAAAVAVASGEGRDVLWRRLTKENASAMEEFWIEILRRTPRGLRVIPLGVTGLVAWVAGDGAMLNICLTEAETLDPDHPLIGLLARIAEAGVPPSRWDGIQADLSVLTVEPVAAG